MSESSNEPPIEPSVTEPTAIEPSAIEPMSEGSRASIGNVAMGGLGSEPIRSEGTIDPLHDSESALDAYPPSPQLLDPPILVEARYLVPWKAITLLAILLVATILGMFLDGEVGRFLQASWEVGLFALLGTLAYVGLDQPVAKVFSWFLLIGMLAMATIANLIFSSLAFSSDDPNATTKLLLSVFLVSCIASSSILLVWIPSIRGLFCKLTGQYEWTSVRLLALAAVLSLTLISTVPLLMLGEPPVLLMFKNGIDLMADPTSSGAENIDTVAENAEALRGDMYALSWTMMGAALAVGYGVKRSWRETLERLGLLAISIRQLVTAVAMIGLMFGLSYLIDGGIAKVWDHFGWPVTDDAAVSKLFSAYMTPIGAVVIAICAGLGEEVAVRGILQPRLGILLSNLFFTAMHAYQYGWDALLSVFLVGVLLGIIRSKSNTTVSALVHGGYDFTLVLAELYALDAVAR